MLNFLHTYSPQAELISFGPITIHWYGVLIVLSLILGSFILVKLSDFYSLNKKQNLDALFWIIVNGIIGARIYHIFLELDFYLEYPFQAFKIWEGGLAIHGAFIAGLLTVFYYAKKLKIDFFQFAAILLPGLILGQAIGRWGNYFNQELYGRPTDLPWSIPIEAVRRLPQYLDYQYFHPAFLYESLGNFLILGLLLFLHLKTGKIRNSFFQKNKFKLIVLAYVIPYSLLRLATETLRLDPTPEIWGLRLPQLVSLIFVISAIIYLFYLKKTEAKIPLK